MIEVQLKDGTAIVAKDRINEDENLLVLTGPMVRMVGQALAQHGPQDGAFRVVGVGHEPAQHGGEALGGGGIEAGGQGRALLAVARSPALPEFLEKCLSGDHHLLAFLGGGGFGQTALHGLGRAAGECCP